MNMRYGHTIWNDIVREMQSCRHTLSILFEYAWSMARVWQEYGKSMGRAWVEAHELRSFRYAACLLLLMVVGVGSVWGQDLSGFYYIANYTTVSDKAKGYDENKPADNYYLCPAAVYYNDNLEMPHLTTKRTNRGANSIWELRKVSGTNYYHIIHYEEGGNGKYLVHNETPSSLSGLNKPNRFRVHLEANPTLENNNDVLFIITQNSGTDKWFSICPKPDENTSPKRSLNPASGNKDSYAPLGDEKNGNKTYSTGGIIGLWRYDRNSEDGASRWYLEKAAPIIRYYSESTIKITYPDPDASIYYSFGEDSTPVEGTNRYSEPFDLPSGTTTIKAIAVKGDKQSGIATYKLPFLLGSAHKYIIQSENCQSYRLIPNVSVDNNTKYVSTLNVPSTTMAWHFEYAEDFYYYIVDENGWYMYYTANNDKYLYLKSSKDNDDDGFKFNIEYHATGGYNIMPKGQGKSIYKNNYGSNDAGLKPVKYDGTITEDVARWDLIPYSTTNLPMWEVAPFDEQYLSNDDYTYYFQIVSVQVPEKCFTLNISGETRGINSLAPSGTGVERNKSLWTIKKVGAEEDNDELLDFYTFQNAFTGEFLYYNGNGRNHVQTVLQMGQPSGGNATWSHFVIVQTANGYNIIPRPIVDNTKAIDRTSNNAGFNCINRRGGGDVLGTFYDDGDGSRWTFALVNTPVKCMQPVFTETVIETGNVITLSCITNASEIFFTDNGDNPTAGGATPTLYTNQTWASTSKHLIKAYAKLKNDATDGSNSDVVTLLNKPDITLEAGPYTYKGTAWEPTVTKVSIGTSPNETEAPTTPASYTASYSGDRINAGTTTATVTLNDADESDLWYIWNASTTFSISPAPVTVTADDKTKEYGTSDPAWTARVEDMQNDEPKSLISYEISRAEGEDVGGTYAITPTGATAQGNYSVTYVSGTLTITAKAVTVTANDIEKTYGDADPTLSATIEGLVNNDPESVISYTISRAEGENVGSYTITPTGATEQGNYTVTYPTGTLTIKKKDLTVTAKDKAITYGEAPANNGVRYGTFAFNEDENDLGGELTYTYNYAQYDDVGSGSYTITPSGLTSSNNYELRFVPGTLTVKRKEVGIGEWSNTTVTYNGSAQAPTATVTTGTVHGDVVGVEVTGGINAGSYTATASGLTGDKAGNYKLPNPAPTSPFTINKARLMEVIIDNNELTYNGTEQTVTITSVTAGDGINVTISDVPSEDYDVSGNSATNAGTHTVTVTPKSPSTNYDADVSVSESYTIGQKSIGDGTNPATANGITIDITWNDDEDDPYIVEVKDGETLLTKDTDYAFSPSPTGNHNTKYYTVTIAGANNYKDSFSAKYANVKFDSNGSEGAMYYGTFVADADHATPASMTPYIITSVANNTATAVELDYIPNDVPIVLMNPTYAKGFLVQSGTGEISTTGNLLEVQATNEEKATAFAYLLYKGEFVLNKAGIFKAGTVYLPASAGGSGARLKIVEGDNTGIENIEYTIDSPSGAWFTLDGRSLSSKPTKKGLYLQSGKKIVVK